MKTLKFRGRGCEKIALAVIVLLQMTLVFFAQITTVVGMDGIFSYTLSNNPYNYLFIDGIYHEFPQNNGWLDAHILKENYVVEEYDRFNYSAVYHHQRYDVHPPLYYFMVHTVSSLFPGRYSNLFSLGINLFALLILDIILIRMYGLLYGSSGYTVVPIAFLMLMESMFFLFTWARMYMLLFMFCAWYLYIHAKMLLLDWKKSDFVQMIVCIFLGTLTHYYFYLYAGMLTFLAILYLVFQRKKIALLRYIYCGIVGIAASWIFYPWVLWHIFINDQNKHTDIEPWTLEKGKEYLLFLRDNLLNGRSWTCVFLLVLWCLGVVVLKRTENGGEEREKKKRSFRKITIGSGLLYSLVIYTLDGDTVYYSTALYMAFIVWASMVILDLIGSVKLPWEKKAVRIGVAVVCVGMLYSGTTMQNYLARTNKVISSVYNGEPLKGEFRRVPDNYRNYNCIYIEEKQDNIFHNYWLYFGEYQMFKKIPLEEFTLHGIRKEDLAGCEQKGDGILVYAPRECEFDERDYRWIAADASYNVYEYVGEQ